MTSKFQQFTVIIDMVLKRVKCDLNGVKIAIFAAKLQKPPSSGGLCPLCDTLDLQRFVHLGTKIRQFLCKKQLLLVQAPSLLAKPWLRFWSHSILQTDFSSDYTGRIRNGLYVSFVKDEYKIVPFKISVFMCKSSVYFIVPPHFRLGPPYFVWSGNGTAGSVRLSRSYSIFRN